MATVYLDMSNLFTAAFYHQREQIRRQRHFSAFTKTDRQKLEFVEPRGRIIQNLGAQEISRSRRNSQGPTAKQFDFAQCGRRWLEHNLFRLEESLSLGLYEHAPVTQVLVPHRSAEQRLNNDLIIFLV